MRYRIFLYLLTAGISAKGQTTETYYDYNREEVPTAAEAQFYSAVSKTDSGWLQTDFFINGMTLRMKGLFADEACKVKNGTFAWFHTGKKIKRLAVYKNNALHGLSISFYPDGNVEDSMVYNNGILQNYGLSWHSNGIIHDSMVYVNDFSVMLYRWFDNGYPDCSGLLLNGKEHGHWTYFHDNGKAAAEIDYDNGKKIKALYFNEGGSPAGPDAVTDEESRFANPDKSFKKFIENRLSWPNGYTITNGESMVTSVSFVVNAAGRTEDIHVYTPVHPAFDQQVVNAVKASRWLPGREHNRKVKSYHIQAVNWALQK